MKGDDHDLMGGGYDRFPLSMLRRPAIEGRRQVTILLVRSPPSRLAKSPPQPTVPFAAAAAVALAGALVVARHQPRPTGGMIRVRKLAHVQAQFGNHRPGRDLIHARNG